MGKLDGKVALVAGGLGKFKKDKFKMGLGGYIAKNFAEEGADVIITDLDKQIAEECAKAIGSDKVKAKWCDLLKDREAEVKKFTDDRGKEKTEVIWKDNPALDMVKEIVEEFGKLDILVTNFDYYEKGKIETVNEEVYQNLKKYNLKPVFHLLAAVRDQFAAQVKQGGDFARIVLLTNMVGKAGLSMGAAYAAMKGAILGANKTIAREFARFARCNAVCMAPLSEKKMQGPADRVKKQFFITSTDMAKMDIKFEHIYPLVTFLVSDEAAAINGQAISVDGGLWLKLEQ